MVARQGDGYKVTNCALNGAAGLEGTPLGIHHQAPSYLPVYDIAL